MRGSDLSVQCCKSAKIPLYHVGQYRVGARPRPAVAAVAAGARRAAGAVLPRRCSRYACVYVAAGHAVGAELLGTVWYADDP